ncbi:MAG: amidohydrolase family protein [Deltaproteobacteria bacterium]|nr:amidohydrolase family protein [Deltaproteobacteria bacterium]
MDLVIRRARLRGVKGLREIAVNRGRIREIAPKVRGKGDREIDANGCLVTSSFVNPHMHADKALLGEIMRPNVSGTLPEAVEITWEFKRRYTNPDVVARAGRVIESAILHGTTAMRLFADVDTIGGLRPVHGLLAAKQAYGHLIDLQVVAFPQEGIIRNPGTEELLWQAMEAGADVAGGLPWFELSDEHARRHIDIVFEIARKHGADIHMLVDDTDDANSRSLEYLAVKTVAEKYQGRVSASHCGALARYNDVYAAKVIGMVKEAEVTICSNPHISLMIAGRLDREPVPRGITRVRELLRAGVNVASGQDDVNDPYYPFGRADQLEVALFMCHAAHLSLPHEIEMAYDLVTVNAARAMGLKDYGLEVGRRADLVVLDAPSVHEALRLQAPRRYVIRAGAVLAESQLTRQLHGTAAPYPRTAPAAPSTPREARASRQRGRRQ